MQNNWKKHTLPLLVFLSGLFTATSAAGQAVNISTHVDSQSILIGSPFHYHIQVEYDEGTKVSWPELRDSLGAFEVLDKKPIDSGKSGNQIVKSQQLKLTTFKPGEQVLPGLRFSWWQKGDTAEQTRLTDSMLIQVNPLTVDTSKAIKPVKHIYDIPVTFAEIWPYIAIGLGALLFIIAGIWLFRRWKRQPVAAPPPAPPRPPHEMAIEKLEHLQKQELWQQGYVKDYHDQLTDIIREYLEEVFQIRALELTTSEIMTRLSPKTLSHEQKEQLREIFEKADLAKFAKANPAPEENEQALSIAFAFIKTTQAPENESAANGSSHQ